MFFNIGLSLSLAMDENYEHKIWTSRLSHESFYIIKNN